MAAVDKVAPNPIVAAMSLSQSLPPISGDLNYVLLFLVSHSANAIEKYKLPMTILPQSEAKKVISHDTELTINGQTITLVMQGSSPAEKMTFTSQDKYISYTCEHFFLY
jgi:hypothetical protein